MIKTLELIDGRMGEVRICDNCGDEILANQYRWWGDESGDFCCLSCFLNGNEDFEKTLTIENAMLVGSTNLQNVTVNEFFSSAFTPEETEDILYKAFCDLPKDKQTELIRRYAWEDEHYWVKELAAAKDENAKKILKGEVV